MSKTKNPKKSLQKKPFIADPSLPTQNFVPVKAEYYTRVKHMANLGDIIASLAAVKKFYEITKRKVMYCQVVNNPAAYYPGAVHPTLDEQGNNVSVNQKGFEMIKPLLESQEYIHSFVKYEGQPIDLNFDVIRGQTDVNMPHGMLPAWLMYVFPDLAADLSRPWVEVRGDCPPTVLKQVKNKIIINYTERYRSHAPMDYFFLKNYAPDIVFSGTEKEHYLFCNKWQLSVPLLEINDFLELAHAIKNCRFFAGNQSFHWNLANAMGTPRLLEVCKWADNCQPNVGEMNFGYFYQLGAEYYFRRMYNVTAQR